MTSLTRGAALVEVEDQGVFFEKNSTSPMPLASLVKVMTAYIVLKEERWSPAMAETFFTIDEAQAARSQAMAEDHQSCVVVEAGQRFLLLDLLRGSLIVSAGNFAEMLAEWSAGSTDRFVRRMNEEAVRLGMGDTTYVDVTGVSDDSVSTARDQVRLAKLAMYLPEFATIVGERDFDAGPAGKLSNTNTLLGVEGVAGMKTGFTEKSGANFLFAARLRSSDPGCRLFGALLGQKDRAAGFDLARSLIGTAREAAV